MFFCIFLQIIWPAGLGLSLSCATAMDTPEQLRLRSSPLSDQPYCPVPEFQVNTPVPVSSWITTASSTQTSCIQPPLNQGPPPDFTSGHGRAATRQTHPMFFCIFLQIIWPAGLGLSLSCATAMDTPEQLRLRSSPLSDQPYCPVPEFQVNTPVPVSSWITTASSTQTSCIQPPLNQGPPPDFTSGHGRAATRQTHPMFFCIFLQVSPCQSLHCKRSSNVNLLLLPCPSVLMSCICECVHVMKLLLLGGDVELNPGPPKEDPCHTNKELMAFLKNLSTKMDKNHAEVLCQITEVKQMQLNLEQQVNSINERLTTVEQKLAVTQKSSELQTVNAEAARSEASSLAKRLDEFEDRSRRDNLIFYGFKDSQSESWSESEKECANFCLPRLTCNYLRTRFNGHTD
ncbi:uncharacterized protein LOC125758515 [Rhipicephalus sanguineus]|uniref:uncharacterized protein LOC125758515 n=1 Tax=Rhipicephalus sanguineus TaxID=34632 RepID=UPI0020C34253|nr:uncharacterized protein LOC125758515 [Rhipicephalus sanguineus]